MRQKNVEVEEGADPRKYEVRALLRFIGYAKDEVAVVQAKTFRPGELLRVAYRNGCGMGIDVASLESGADMVWPEEVQLAEDLPDVRIVRADLAAEARWYARWRRRLFKGEVKGLSFRSVRAHYRRFTMAIWPAGE